MSALLKSLIVIAFMIVASASMSFAAPENMTPLSPPAPHGPHYNPPTVPPHSGGDANYCITHYTDRGCPGFCNVNYSSDPSCPGYCNVHYTDRGCPGFCNVNYSSDPSCPGYCNVHYTDRGCPGYCNVHYTEPGCPGYHG